LESEAPAVVEHQRPDADWPEGGAIKFENVDVRYREGLPLVLKNISLDIQPREKIGIVGRTGSGKTLFHHSNNLIISGNSVYSPIQYSFNKTFNKLWRFNV